MNLEQKKRCWMYVSQGPEGWLAHQFTGAGLARYLANYRIASSYLFLLIMHLTFLETS